MSLGVDSAAPFKHTVVVTVRRIALIADARTSGTNAVQQADTVGHAALMLVPHTVLLDTVDTAAACVLLLVEVSVHLLLA